MKRKNERICWLLINTSHYHVARWTAFSRYDHYTTTLVELANKDAGFTALESKSMQSTGRVTLFPGKNWRQVSGRQRRVVIHAELDRLQPDVVCVNGWSTGGALAALEWCLSNGKRTVVFSESNAFDRSRPPPVESIKRRILRLVDAGLAGGTAARDYLVELGMRSECIGLGYDVVDNAHFAPPPSGALQRRSDAPAGPFFVAAARFEPKKNHVILLNAYAAYRRRAGEMAWPLVILGDGLLLPEIQAHARDLRLGADLHLPGFAGYEDLPGWYGPAGCFIHPSTTEQWGLVVNEAMAAGLPVLVSERCGCVPDLVRPGANGYIFDPCKPETLAQLMFRMAHGGVDLAAMGQASQRIIADWGPDRFAQGLVQAVEAALGAEPKRADPLDRLLLRVLGGR